MEVIGILLISAAAVWLVRGLVAPVAKRRSGAPTPEEATPAGLAPSARPALPTFRVVALGTSGSGKTVLLASMFHKLNHLTPERSFYLESGAEQRVALGRIYSTVSDTSKPWPRGTRTGETREFLFDCVAVDRDNARLPVLRMSYLDYAGELLEVEQEEGSTALDDLAERIAGANALLGMIDGHRMLQLLRGEAAGRNYFQHALQPMFGFMQGASCPIHLVLTKWDLVRDFGEPEDADEAYRLNSVIEALLEFEHIKALVYVHSKNQIVRLIPVSAVGPSFVQINDAGHVSKLPDGTLRPTNVEVPLAAVLPDLFSQVERSLDDSARKRIDTEMRRNLRKHVPAIAASLLARPAAAALRAAMPGYGSLAMSLFIEARAPLDQLVAPIFQSGSDLEKELASQQRLRAIVMNDFKRTLLRFEAVLPNSELSRRW